MKRKGICFVCGCTDDAACPEGCSWANVKQTLCTSCVDLPAKAREVKRAAALAELAAILETLADEALDVKARMRVLDP